MIGFYGFRLLQSVVFSTHAFQTRWLVCKHDASFQGARNSKTSRNKLQQKTEYIILALQAEKTNDKPKKVQFTLYHKRKHACL